MKPNCPETEDRRGEEDRTVPVVPNDNHIESFFNHWSAHEDIHKSNYVDFTPRLAGFVHRWEQSTGTVQQVMPAAWGCTPVFPWLCKGGCKALKVLEYIWP